MASSTTPPTPGAFICFGTLVFPLSDAEGSLADLTSAQSPQTEQIGETGSAVRATAPAPLSPVHVAAERVFAALSTRLPLLLGPDPSQERFRDVTYSLANIVLQLACEEPLAWSEFVASYAAMYPDGQPDWLRAHRSPSGKPFFLNECIHADKRIAPG